MNISLDTLCAGDLLMLRPPRAAHRGAGRRRRGPTRGDEPRRRSTRRRRQTSTSTRHRCCTGRSRTRATCASSSNMPRRGPRLDRENMVTAAQTARASPGLRPRPGHRARRDPPRSTSCGEGRGPGGGHRGHHRLGDQPSARISTRTRITAEGHACSAPAPTTTTDLMHLLRSGATDAKVTQRWREAMWVKPRGARGWTTGLGLRGRHPAGPQHERDRGLTRCVRYFAAAAAAAGTEEEHVATPLALSRTDLAQLLVSLHPVAPPGEPPSRRCPPLLVARGRRGRQDPHSPAAPGAAVDVLPPFAGGRAAPSPTGPRGPADSHRGSTRGGRGPGSRAHRAGAALAQRAGADPASGGVGRPRAPARPPIQAPLARASGRVSPGRGGRLLAPHYASSAMDGYAVRGPGCGPGDRRLAIRPLQPGAPAPLPSAASAAALAPGTAVPVVAG
ncbi:hypothetical protein QJS66_20195 [Kocuria rhizophila]|nr:hypothetical protein QJS66_20195 [Kocuria rhizophila]